MPQIIRITSEALQATIRRLLPSQQGFGEDLQASNVITPVIDLTPTAEGSSLPDYLQTASDYGVTVSFISNTTTAITSTAGFYQLGLGVTGTSGTASVQLTDGVTPKILWAHSGNQLLQYPSTLYVYVPAGYTLNGVSNNLNITLECRSKQIADVNGVLNDPFGFTPQ